MVRSFQSTLSRVAVLLTLSSCGIVSMAQTRDQVRRTPPPQGPSVQRPPRIGGEAAPRPARPMESPRSERERPERERPERERPERERTTSRPESSERQTRRLDPSERLGRRPESSERPLRAHPSDKPVLRPRPLPRLMVLPTPNYWQTRYRSINSDITFLSRRGFIPVTAVPSDIYEIVDYAETPAGWRGYGFVVPPGESVIINLEHTNRAWFRLIICDAWGRAVPGGLSSKLPQHEPRLSYKNVSDEARAIYLIVDDPGWMSSEGNPYFLEIVRSWDPALIPVDQTMIASGIWGLEKSVNAKFRGPMLVMPGFK